MTDRERCQTCDGDGNVIAVYSKNGRQRGFSPDAICLQCKGFGVEPVAALGENAPTAKEG